MILNKIEAALQIKYDNHINSFEYDKANATYQCLELVQSIFKEGKETTIEMALTNKEFADMFNRVNSYSPTKSQMEESTKSQQNRPATRNKL